MSEKSRFLFVEDNHEQAKSILTAFQASDIWTVEWAQSFNDAQCRLNSADVVLCDRNLPDGDGLSLLEIAREQNIDAAFVMLTAVDTIEERVRGLELGAADYVGKGVDVREVVMRCEAQARNVARNRAMVPEQIVLGGASSPAEERLTILPASRLATRTSNLAKLVSKRDRQAFTLEPTAFAILMHLVRRQGSVVPITEIEERFFFRTEHTRQGVRNAISKIRRCVDGKEIRAFLHTHLARSSDDRPGYAIMPDPITKETYLSRCT